MSAHEAMLRISNIINSERPASDMIASIAAVVEEYEADGDEYDDDSDLDSDLDVDSDLDEDFEDD